MKFTRLLIYLKSFLMREISESKKLNGKIWEGVYRSFDEVKSDNDIFSEKI